MQEHECEEGTACAVDFTEEAKPKQQISFNKEYIAPAIGVFFLLLGIALDYFEVGFFQSPIPIIWFGIIYLFIGGPIVKRALQKIAKGDIYNEFVLMSVATIGAFAIGSYGEGVAVMLFYVIGELFQESAINRAKRSIEALLKVQVEEVTLLENGVTITKHPNEISIGSIIQTKAGQKVALDGILTSDQAMMNTAALTGESVPDNKKKGEVVLAGMINLNKVIEIKTTSKYEDTKLSKILKMVQEAVGRKAKTQLLISRLAKVYTPIVFWLAVALVAIPFLVMGDGYVFQTWFHRALIFLVISCPCALVVSIPLGYFGGIGAGSKNGILFKGANFLDLITQVDTIVMDKTGTLTEGVFEVQEIVPQGVEKELLLRMAATLEMQSTHPIGKAIVDASAALRNSGTSPTLSDRSKATEVEEIAGHGLIGTVENRQVMVGNTKLLDKYNVSYDPSLRDNKETIVLVAIDQKYAGYITIADTIKEDAQEAIDALRKIDAIQEIVMLSGDKQVVVDRVAKKLGIRKAIGGLLPEGKIKEVEKLKAAGRKIAFLGDGINDAPVITLSDVGMAMGGLGSDAAIETADVVIQNDQPSKIATAIRIGNATKSIVWQNIFLALGVKILVLILGAFGMATMWEAVIADVGVALLAILNSVRIQRMDFT